MSATENTTPTPADLERMARELGFRPRADAAASATEDKPVPAPADDPQRELFAAWFEAEAARAGFDGEALVKHFDPATFTGEDGKVSRVAVAEFIATMSAGRGER